MTDFTACTVKTVIYLAVYYNPGAYSRSESYTNKAIRLTSRRNIFTVCRRIRVIQYFNRYTALFFNRLYTYFIKIKIARKHNHSVFGIDRSRYSYSYFFNLRQLDIAFITNFSAQIGDIIYYRIFPSLNFCWY